MQLEDTSRSQPIQPLFLHSISRNYVRNTPGLGFVDPFSAAMALQSANSFVSKIESFFGIGTGRREADQIVPVQNQVFDTVIKPIYDLLDSGRDLSYNELQQMYQAITIAESKWLSFLHDTEWSDGRAASQAESTLAQYFSDPKQEIQKRLSALTGGIISGGSMTDYFPTYIPGFGPSTGMQEQPQRAGFDTMSMLLLAGVAFAFLASRKSRRFGGTS